MPSQKCVTVGELADGLSKCGVPHMGRNRLFSWLRASGYLGSIGATWNTPTQMSLELGLFEVALRTVRRNGVDIIAPTTLVTSAGQEYFARVFEQYEVR